MVKKSWSVGINRKGVQSIKYSGKKWRGQSINNQRPKRKYVDSNQIRVKTKKQNY